MSATDTIELMQSPPETPVEPPPPREENATSPHSFLDSHMRTRVVLFLTAVATAVVAVVVILLSAYLLIRINVGTTVSSVLFVVASITTVLGGISVFDVLRHHIERPLDAQVRAMLNVNRS